MNNQEPTIECCPHGAEEPDCPVGCHSIKPPVEEETPEECRVCGYNHEPNCDTPDSNDWETKLAELLTNEDLMQRKSAIYGCPENVIKEFIKSQKDKSEKIGYEKGLAVEHCDVKDYTEFNEDRAKEVRQSTIIEIKEMLERLKMEVPHYEKYPYFQKFTPRGAYLEALSDILNELQ